MLGLAGLFLLVSSHLSFAEWIGCSIYSLPMEKEVMSGDIFTMDMMVYDSNPRYPYYADFDTLLAWMSYDPTYLEVQDADLVTPGVQIQSDPLGIFNFNYHMVNNVDATQGKIDLEESFLSGGTSHSSGAFARITFKALRLGSTSLTYQFNTWGYTPTTALLRGGGDLLGDSDIHNDGIAGSTINVIPEPTTLSLSLIGGILLNLLRLPKKRR